MRLFFFLALMPFAAHALTSVQALSFKKMKGMDWWWRMTTDRPSEVLELDCQSFIHSFRHLREGQEPRTRILEEEECFEMAQKLKKCFPLPGKACVRDVQSAEMNCGRCP